MIRVGIGAAVLIIVLAAIFFGFSKAKKAHEAEVAQSVAKPTPTPVSNAPDHTVPGDAAPTKVKRIDPETRQRLLAQITAARARRGETTKSSSGGTSGDPGAPQELTKDYIRTQVRELIPLLQECYQKELDEDPKLGGNLVVQFTMGGEPGIGGVIEDSVIDPDKSTITNANMIECVRETMYGLEFDPPADGGKVVVNYPFAFSSGESPAK